MKFCLFPGRFCCAATVAWLLLAGGLLFGLAPVLVAAGANPTSASAVPLPTLTTARAAHGLTSEEAARGYPIHLRAVVTYFDPSIGSRRASLFVHDATGAIYVELATGSDRNLAPGMLLDIRGVSGRGEFAPIVSQPRIQVLGRAALPGNAPRVSLARLKEGIETSQWIEVEGMVHSVTKYDHNVMLSLAMDGGTVTVVMVRQAGADYESLIDAEVRVHANASQTFNSKRQMIGVRLMCPGMAAISIVEASSGDSFNKPVLPVDKLLRWDQVTAELHRVHVRGRLTLQWPGDLLCIHDRTEGICAQSAQESKVALGSTVDIVGFVEAKEGVPVLRDAIYRGGATGPPIMPKRLNAEQALYGGYGTELVQVEGTLVGKDAQASEATLLLTSGNKIFTAALPLRLAGTQADDWQIGSILRVTGICAITLDTQRSAIGEGMAVPKYFRILLRSPGDVAIVRSPSWWTPAHTAMLLVAILAGTLLVLTWVVALRKRVEQQTHLLRESEERFRQMAWHDTLTGLASRLLLQDRLNVAIQSVRRHRSGLALIMLDIDKFKQINDSYGHQTGDEVLREAADRLLKLVRKSDTVARMGGDEFVVLLSDLNDAAAAERIAGNIVENLAVPVSFAGAIVPISVSVGVCTSFEAELDVDALLKNADGALYQAKAGGRNCYRVFAQEGTSVPAAAASTRAG